MNPAVLHCSTIDDRFEPGTVLHGTSGGGGGGGRGRNFFKKFEPENFLPGGESSWPTEDQIKNRGFPHCF